MLVDCPDASLETGIHAAHAISGGGGFSIGNLRAYYPVCRRLVKTAWSMTWLAKASRLERGSDDGLRLDEIIRAIGGDPLPPLDGKRASAAGPAAAI